MSTTHWREKILVRHKGKVATVEDNGNDAGFRRVTGNRRSRQIGKRHWLRKESTGWSSGGGHWDTVSIKPPSNPERHLRRPIRG